MMNHSPYKDLYLPTEGSPLPCSVLLVRDGEVTIRLPDPYDQGEIQLMVDAKFVILGDEDA